MCKIHHKICTILDQLFQINLIIMLTKWQIQRTMIHTHNELHLSLVEQPFLCFSFLLPCPSRNGGSHFLVPVAMEVLISSTVNKQFIRLQAMVPTDLLSGVDWRSGTLPSECDNVKAWISFNTYPFALWGHPSPPRPQSRILIIAKSCLKEVDR